MKVLVGRKRVDFKTLDVELQGPGPVVALGPGMPEPDLAFAFPDWAALVKFARRRPMSDVIARLDERRRKLPRRQDEDLTAVIARQRLLLKRAHADMQELAGRTGLALSSKALFLRATVKADPLEGPVFDPATLHTGTSFSGQGYFVGYPGSPDFRWHAGLNNAVSSVRGFGALALFNRTWFEGASRIFLGNPGQLGYFQNTNLASVGVNNRASSALID